EQIKEDTKLGFESVKKDITSVSGWIKHLDSEKNLQQKEIVDLKEDLSSVKKELEGLKNVFTIMNELKPNRVFKLSKQLSKHQN
ncbi:hypothetical protein KAR52_03615, partial [Candidatus Pacearchaeota archaeon]|nr:hypothetical protein [Candidatus Pacearchaeota archaeon]